MKTVDINNTCKSYIINEWMKDLPKPAPDSISYNKNLHQALLNNNFKRNYEAYTQSKNKKSSKLSYLPIKLDIENVSRCNFRCHKCQISTWPNGKRANDMSFENYKNLLDVMYGLIEIKLQGIGEPLLGGKTFFQMIEYARSKNIWVRTTTNASLLHLNDNYKKIIDSDVSELQISVDGTKKQIFESIRRGSDFELVVKNIKMINRYCMSKNLLKTRMWTCLQKSNFEYLVDFVKFAKELGFVRLTFSMNLHGWGQKEFFDRNKSESIDDFLDKYTLLQLVEIGKKNGVEVTFWNNVSTYNWKEQKNLCPWPFERLYISSDMKVVPCCKISNPDVVNFGDANDIINVWNSDTLVKFREMHLNGNLPDYCVGCYNGLW